MNISLNRALDQLIQTFDHFYPSNSLHLPVYDLAFFSAGWLATADLANHFSRTYPLFTSLKTPISLAASFSLVALSRYSPRAGATTAVILSIISLGLNRLQPNYSAHSFKSFLPNVSRHATVQGDIDLSDYTNVLPTGTTFTGKVILSPQTFNAALESGVVFRSTVTVKGNLEIFGFKGESLPEGLRVEGNLKIQACLHLKSLPPNLAVTGDLQIISNPALEILPNSLQIGGGLRLEMSPIKSVPKIDLRDLEIVSCAHFETLPEGLHVTGDLVIAYCANFETLPEGLHVTGDLLIKLCPKFKSVPKGLHAHDLLVLGCNMFEELPAEIEIQQNLSVTGCDSFTKFPSDLKHINGDLNLSENSNLEELPEGLNIEGNFYIFGPLDCTPEMKIKSLPAQLTVGGNLVAARAVQLQKVSEKTVIKGGLFLHLCLQLTHLSEDIVVGGMTDLTGCKKLKSVPPQLTNVKRDNTL